jgi:hypothetical protein
MLSSELAIQRQLKQFDMNRSQGMHLHFYAQPIRLNQVNQALLVSIQANHYE